MNKNAVAGNASMREAFSAAVERSGKLDLVLPTRLRKRKGPRARYLAKRAAATAVSMAPTQPRAATKGKANVSVQEGSGCSER